MRGSIRTVVGITVHLGARVAGEAAAVAEVVDGVARRSMGSGVIEEEIRNMAMLE